MSRPLHACLAVPTCSNKSLREYSLRVRVRCLDHHLAQMVGTALAVVLRLSNCSTTLLSRKKKSHQILIGSSMNTTETARSCLIDSASVTKCSGIANVSKGRRAIMLKQKARAIEAHTSAAFRAHGRSWKRPMPVPIPSATRNGGTSAIRAKGSGWTWYAYLPFESGGRFNKGRKNQPHKKKTITPPSAASAAAAVTPAERFLTGTMSLGMTTHGGTPEKGELRARVSKMPLDVRFLFA